MGLGGVTSLTFNLNGGNVSAVTDPVVVDAVIGSKILEAVGIPTPVFAEHTFEGWAYDAEGTNPVLENDVVSANLTVYAVWEEDEDV